MISRACGNPDPSMKYNHTLIRRFQDQDYGGSFGQSSEKNISQTDVKNLHIYSEKQLKDI